MRPSPAETPPVSATILSAPGVIRQADAMTLDAIDTDRAGFAPQSHARAQVRRTAAIFQLITLLALLLSTVVAMTAVLIGIARAHALAAAAEDPTARTAAAILFALVLVGIGGLTALRSQAEAKSGQ